MDWWDLGREGCGVDESGLIESTIGFDERCSSDGAICTWLQLTLLAAQTLLWETQLIVGVGRILRSFENVSRKGIFVEEQLIV